MLSKVPDFAAEQLCLTATPKTKPLQIGTTRMAEKYNEQNSGDAPCFVYRFALHQIRVLCCPSILSLGPKMSGGALRRASSVLLGRLSGSARSGTSLQQQRGTHDLSVHPNKHVEQWLSKREDIDAEFVWNRQTVWHVIIGVIVIPTAIYNSLVWQAHKDDDFAGRPRRLVPLCSQDLCGSKPSHL